MMRIAIKDDARAAILRLRMLVGSERVMKRVGKRVEVFLRRHFKEKDASSTSRAKWRDPHMAAGMPKMHFWGRIRNVTSFTGATSTTASVTIADPAMGARVFGATILPKEAGALAIPLQPRVAGKMPRGNPVLGLKLIKTHEGTYLVTRGYEVQGKDSRWKARKDLSKWKAGAWRELVTYWYRLIRSAKHPQDPTALPKPEAVSAEVGRELEAISRQLWDSSL